MRFEWDETKNGLNQRKHGFSFQEVTGVFLDPLTVIVPDGYDHGEHRWRAFGRSNRGILLVVVHAQQPDDSQGDVIRLISARAATRQERRSYEENEDG